MSDPIHPPAALPERIGAYRIERRLGTGGMGEVFLGWDDRLERRVAIKRIREDACLPPTLRERFRHEARAAARLSHSAIAQVYDLVESGTGDAIVMEYVEGTTLAERLTRGPLALAEAVRLGRQIAEGLGAAHQAGLIHRDLKAENVIVTPEGQAKILDFGLSRPVQRAAGEALTQQGVLLGTFHAMSPEQARGRELDPRSDLFSLGALLYHMLVGCPPFRTESPTETLRRVVTEDPPPLSLVRPGVPSALAGVVERLLAKDPDRRPGTAREVALNLAAIEPQTADAPDFGASVSDLPTKALPVTPSPPAPESPVGTPPSSPAARPLRRLRWAWVAAVSLAAVALAAGAFYAARPGPEKILRVVIAPPEVTKAIAGPQLELAASGVVSASLSGLSSLEGLAPIDPNAIPRGGGTPIEIARSTAADEVMATKVEADEGTLARISLRRIQGNDGRVLWSSTFKVPTDPDGLHLLADQVVAQVQKAYAGFPLRPGRFRIEAREEDYAAFLVAQRDFDSGSISGTAALARLNGLLATSPLLLEARLLAADICLELFRATHDASLLAQARDLMVRAHELAPGDPRLLLRDFRIELEGGRASEAEAALDQYERLLPGDPDVLVLRAELAESAGRLADALRNLTTAASRAPSWQNLFRLADMKARSGRIDEAREVFTTLIRESPGNVWMQEGLGNLELNYGALDKAEAIFRSLTRIRPQRAWLNNLGTARLLLGDPAGAEEAYRQALALEPNHPLVLLNLADAEVDLGHRQAAADLYRRALERLETAESARGFQPRPGMLKAQCLARLGRVREAVEVAHRALRISPDDPSILFFASLVDCLAGERNSALTNAQAAIAKGWGRRWFALSAFAPLRNDASFLTLTDTTGGRNNPVR